jgi:hypothetical protein
MFHLGILGAVILAIAGVLAPSPARADAGVEGASTTQEVVVSAPALACAGHEPRDARRLAKEAQRNGEHQRAVDCFRIAGDHLRADRAMVKVSAETHATARADASVAAATAKEQARRLREAFR